MNRKLRTLVLLIAPLFILGASLIWLVPSSTAGGYWHPTNKNDCPSNLVCATMDLNSACCIEWEDLWSSDVSACPSGPSFRHIHGLSDQL